MAAITSCSLPIAAAATGHGSAAGSHRRPTLVSRFHGVHLAAEAKAVRSQNSKRMPGMVTATCRCRYWREAGETAASETTPNSEYGLGFNGGFNQPIMSGGEPRVMTRKERGSLCEPIYAIQINVPSHDHGIICELKGLPQSYFEERLAKELAHEGTCEDAIYPEAVFIRDRCAFPAGMIQQGLRDLSFYRSFCDRKIQDLGDRCDLDIVSGCTDPESPFFDPLTNVDDGSCPFISDGEN